MTVPAPVSHFDWHEGSGTTTTSLVSAHTLTSNGTAAYWNAGGGTTSTASWAGAVGATGARNDYTVVFDVKLTATFTAIKSFAHDVDTPWLNIRGTTAAGSPPGVAYGIGPWSPDQFTATGMTVGQRQRIAFVFTAAAATKCQAYIDGVSVGSFTTGSYATNFNSWTIIPQSNIIYAARFWDVALTGAEVAELEIVSFPVSAAFSGAGVLSATVSASFAASAALSGAGVLSAVAAESYPAAADFSGAGVLSTAVTASLPVPADFSGVGTLTAAVAQAPQSVTVVFNGAGALLVRLPAQSHMLGTGFTVAVYSPADLP